MQLSDLKWPEVSQLSRELPCVIPIAAVEQHSTHLPLYTDSYLLSEVVDRVESQVGDRALVLPLQWFGHSDHHLDFSGTLSAQPSSYMSMLRRLVENLLHHGFQRILVLNGHGGNNVPGQQALFEVRQAHRTRHDLLLLFSAYWDLADMQAPGHEQLHQQHMGHACEWETSMMLVIKPDLVGDYQGLSAVDSGPASEPAIRAWTTKDRSELGHIGHPHLANAQKGEWLLQRFTEGAVDLIERMANWDGKSWAEVSSA